MDVLEIEDSLSNFSNRREFKEDDQIDKWKYLCYCEWRTCYPSYNVLYNDWTSFIHESSAASSNVIYYIRIT